MRLVSGVALLALLLPGSSGRAQAPGPQVLPVEPPFWRARPPAEWTSGELIQFFTDSPWSHAASLVEPGTVVLGGPRYYVQWFSARTMREALARQAQLQGRADARAAAEFLAAPQDSYQLYLFAGFITENGSLRLARPEVFEGMTEEELRQGTRLQFSALEYASRPDEVELLRREATGELRGVRLTFRRARVAVPPEQATAGQVQLTCPTRRGSLSVRFVLNEMQRDGKPDL